MFYLRFCICSGASLLVAASSWGAQVPSTVMPGREIKQFSQPVSPLSKPAIAVLKLSGSAAPQGAAKMMLTVKRVEINGMTVYSQSEVADITTSLTGKSVTVQAIYDAAAKLTSRYGNDGYVFTRVIVPPQELDPSGATIILQAVEGYVDHVEWPDRLKSLHPALVDGYTAKITAQRPANIKTIERYLLLANDLPGVTVRSKFEASPDNTGATTLRVEEDYKPYAVQAQIDNRGTTGRGPWEYVTSLEESDRLGLGEHVGLAYAGTFPAKELQYVSGYFDTVLNSEGLKLFGSASYSRGWPGIFSLQQLGYSTTSLNLESGLSYPVLRSRDKNLSFSGSFFLEDATGDTSSGAISKDRIRGLRLRANFDSADEYGGLNQLQLSLSQGIAGLGATANGNALASRLSGRPDFTSVELSASRLQSLGHNFSLLGAIDATYAFNPLLAAEQCSYGGKTFGRAFDASELAGDRCFSALAELRYDIPNLPQHIDTAQIYAFSDIGAVYRIAPVSGEDKADHGASAGVGFRTGFEKHVNLDLSAAKPLYGRNSDSWRFFLALNTHF